MFFTASGFCTVSFISKQLNVERLFSLRSSPWIRRNKDGVRKRG